jgi:ABC-type bacteriocin/lantibiotic exporter with double-glycine peptidase domain
VIGDVQTLTLGVGEVMVETWDTLLFSVSLVVAMFIYAPGLAAISLVPVPFALWLAKAAGRRVAARTTHARQSDADLTTVLHEQLGAFRLLRLAGRAGVATGRVRLLADRQATAELDAIRLETGLAAMYTTMLTAGVVFVIAIGGHRVATGAMSVGGLVAFLLLFGRFVGRSPRIPQMANRVQAAGAAYVRLQPLLAPPPPLTDESPRSSFRFAHVAAVETPPPTPPPAPRHAGALTFRAVDFSYPESAGKLAIADLNLEVAAGTLVAITGPVGSGKSALARLAAGVYPPDRGRVLTDGMPVAELEPLERAQRVGYLGQEPHLFSGSIAENVLLLADASSADLDDPRLRDAVQLAALERDIETMPEGLRTEIGELGVRVSGGQRQRIALARAIAAGWRVPGLLVLDDPFSAVDVHTEASIAAALRQAVGGASTILLCSHRLAAFPYADQVVVLDHGRIEEQGSHTELLAGEGLYARIFHAQARLSIAHDALGSRGR